MSEKKMLTLKQFIVMTEAWVYKSHSLADPVDVKNFEFFIEVENDTHKNGQIVMTLSNGDRLSFANISSDNTILGTDFLLFSLNSPENLETETPPVIVGKICSVASLDPMIILGEKTRLHIEDKSLIFLRYVLSRNLKTLGFRELTNDSKIPDLKRTGSVVIYASKGDSFVSFFDSNRRLHCRLPFNLSMTDFYISDTDQYFMSAEVERQLTLIWEECFEVSKQQVNDSDNKSEKVTHKSEDQTPSFQQPKKETQMSDTTTSTNYQMTPEVFLRDRRKTIINSIIHQLQLRFSAESQVYPENGYFVKITLDYINDRVLISQISQNLTELESVFKDMGWTRLTIGDLSHQIFFGNQPTPQPTPSPAYATCWNSEGEEFHFLNSQQLIEFIKPSDFTNVNPMVNGMFTGHPPFQMNGMGTPYQGHAFQHQRTVSLILFKHDVGVQGPEIKNGLPSMNWSPDGSGGKVVYHPTRD